MQAIWKRIFAYLATPFRRPDFVFPGPGEGRGPLAGRYTRPARMKDIEPSADYLIG